MISMIKMKVFYLLCPFYFVDQKLTKIIKINV